MSLRDLILQSADIKSENLSVPQWGVELNVKTMTAVERSRLVASCTSKVDGEDKVDMEKMYPLLIVAAVFDPETGEKVFTLEDVSALQDKSAAAIELVASKVMEMSGMTKDAVDKEGKDN